jgi:hypothetical protein
MNYYLMENVAERRMMIDSKPHAGCPVCDTTTAGSWIEAKKNFGFELTGVQAMMLEMQSAKAA